MAHDVFLSYAKPDGAAAVAVCRALEAGAMKVWMAPRDVPPGADWPSSIPRAIADAKAVVLLFSKHADASEWVPKEIQLALGRKKRIIPFRLVDAEPSGSLELFVNSLQWIDGFPGPLAERLPELTRQTQRILGVQPPAAPVPKNKLSQTDSRKIAPPSPPPVNAPSPLMPAIGAPSPLLWGGAAAAVITVALVVGGMALFSTEDKTPTYYPASVNDTVKSTVSCGSANDNSLWTAAQHESELPGVKKSGAATVLDVQTLSIDGKTVKLAGVGDGYTNSAMRLRNWLKTTGEIVSCVSVNPYRCSYDCENAEHADIGGYVLRSGWARSTPR